MLNPNLKTFLCVADCGSFNRAAEKLSLSPPSVMKQINALEKHLELKVLERTSQGIRLTELGGTMDITASDPAISDHSASEKIAYCLRSGADPERITISSDGCGSQPRFNEKGECIGLDYTSPKVLLIELKNCVFKEEIPLETALGFLTANPARVIGKAGVKGCLQAGADADLIVLNEDLDIVHVMAKGVHAYDQGKAILKGRFER